MGGHSEAQRLMPLARRGLGRTWGLWQTPLLRAGLLDLRALTGETHQGERGL